MKVKHLNTGKSVRILPILLALMLCLTAFGGTFRLLLIGRSAVENTTRSEKLSMSKTVNLSLDYHKNDVPAKSGVIGSVVDRNKVTLYNPANSVSAAFRNVVGINGELAQSGNYLVSCYAEELTKDYSFWTGLLNPPKVTITLDGAKQEQVYQYMMSHNATGSALLYNYKTGEVLCMVSTPSAEAGDSKPPEGALKNKCLGNTAGGSTMKILTTMLLMEQGIDPTSIVAECTGSYTLPSGKEIHCTGQHGKLRVEQAIGQSCNVWFAVAVSKLNVEKTVDSLKNWGFSVNGEGGRTSLERLQKSPSAVSFNGDSFHDVWALLGQTSLASPLDMVEFVGAIAQDGSTAKPRLMAKTKAKTERIFNAGNAKWLKELWESAFQTYYDKETYSMMTAAKTGTIQLGGSKEARTLMGYCEGKNVAFFIDIDNYKGDNQATVTVQELASVLLE